MVQTLQLQSVMLTKEDGVAVVTLNEPDKLNRSTPSIIGGLHEALKYVERDSEIRVMVLTGAGRAFHSGGDVSSFEKLSTDGSPPLYVTPQDSAILAVYKGLRHLDKPTIAAVNGYAIGAGFTLALACDIRIASEAARFSLPQVRLGLLPDVGGSWFLPRVVGLSKACELTFTADMIDAQEAERIGLVSRTVPHEELMPVTLELAHKIARNAPLALRVSKRALYSNLSNTFDEAFDLELYLATVLLRTEDGLEGGKAFLEKREPVWKGR